MEITILDKSTFGDDLDYSPLCSFGKVNIYSNTSRSEFADRVKNSDVIFLNKFKLTSDLIEKAPKLKLVCEAATGYDNIDLEKCREKGIAVTNVPAYSTDCVAQLTMAMALELVMHLKEYTSFVSSGEYTVSGSPNRLTPSFSELSGKTWGIVGLGNIGKKVAKLADAFGCRVIACKRTADPSFTCVDIDTLCENSDIISIHTPLTESTRGLISKARIDRMKSNAILINVARGAVVDEAEVANALLEGRLAGFGCDVYSAEPFPKEHPYTKLLSCPNVCLTPHIAWGAYETRTRLLGEMIENMKAFWDGKIRNRID